MDFLGSTSLEALSRRFLMGGMRFSAPFWSDWGMAASQALQGALGRPEAVTNTHHQVGLGLVADRLCSLGFPSLVKVSRFHPSLASRRPGGIR